MTSRFLPLPLRLAVAVASSVMATVAYAQTHTLSVQILDSKSRAPINGAMVTITQAAASYSHVSGADGKALFPNLTQGTWSIRVTRLDYRENGGSERIDSGDVEVVVTLEGLPVHVIQIVGHRLAVTIPNPTQGRTTTGTQMAGAAQGAGNPQSINKILRTAPSAVEDSSGQLHVRGEHSATAIYLNGFRLPGAFQGHSGQIVTPSIVSDLNFMDGAFAPEFGGETAAVLDIKVRTGQKKSEKSLFLDAGSYQTADGDLTLSGGFGNGPSSKIPAVTGLVDVSFRRTNLAIEPPQPDDQTAHNYGDSVTTFGHFQWHMGPQDSLDFLVSHNPAYTQIANRTGLPKSFAAYGQGFGYLGQLTAAQALDQGIISQQAAGQSINQRDINEFGIVQWIHESPKGASLAFGVGLTHAGSDLTNSNPAVDLNNLPADNSIEFNPSLERNGHSLQFQGTAGWHPGHHAIKAGFSIESQSGDEAYQFIPASKLALAGLIAVDPRLAPVNGVASTLRVKRSGGYDAGYLQDTWQISKRLVTNFGVRFDSYNQTETPSTNGVSDVSGSIKKDFFSPRLNLSYVLSRNTILAAAYNKLFIIPPLAQGSFLGSQISPETLDQYDISIERKIGRTQTIKIAGYYKDIRDQIDTGVLIPGTQIGVFTSVNFDTGSARGLEFSYELSPVGGKGLSGSLAYSQGLDRPGGVTNTGSPAPQYNDHDQLNTFSAGLSYQWKDETTFGVSFLAGSGTASSVLANGLARHPKTELDLQFATSPKGLGGHLRLSLSVENLLDTRGLLNFQSGFSGTRFQPGRRIVFGLQGKF